MTYLIKRIIVTVIGLFVLLITAAFVYLGADQYKPSDIAIKTIDNNREQISETDDYIFFDSKNDSDAIIFYPGAKVDSKAYARIAIDLMNEDIDVFILKYPFNFALADIVKADKVLEDYNYENIYLAGHSLGGVCAAMHIDKHPEEFDGLILLASYSSVKIPDEINVLVFRGTNDQVMKLDNYNEDLSNLPDTYKEVVIEGGNHGQFGSYGMQKGDGVPKISEDEQRMIIVDNILELVGIQHDFN